MEFSSNLLKLQVKEDKDRLILLLRNSQDAIQLRFLDEISYFKILDRLHQEAICTNYFEDFRQQGLQEILGEKIADNQKHLKLFWSLDALTGQKYITQYFSRTILTERSHVRLFELVCSNFLAYAGC